jgi:hypothetical protein
LRRETRRRRWTTDRRTTKNERILETRRREPWRRRWTTWYRGSYGTAKKERILEPWRRESRRREPRRRRWTT